MSWWAVIALFLLAVVCAVAAVELEDDSTDEGWQHDGVTDMRRICSVDGTATESTPGYGVSVFKTMTDAIDGCGTDTIYIRNVGAREDWFEDGVDVTK